MSSRWDAFTIDELEDLEAMRGSVNGTSVREELSNVIDARYDDEQGSEDE